MKFYDWSVRDLALRGEVPADGGAPDIEDVLNNPFRCPRCEQAFVLERTPLHPSAKTLARRQDVLGFPEHGFDASRDLSMFNRCPSSLDMVVFNSGEFVRMFDPTLYGGVTYYEVYSAVQNGVSARCDGDHSVDSFGYGSGSEIEIDIDDAVESVLRMLAVPG